MSLSDLFFEGLAILSVCLFLGLVVGDIIKWWFDT